MKVFEGPRDHCGVFGVYGHEDAAKLNYFGLYALQHRGSGVGRDSGLRRKKSLRIQGYGVGPGRLQGGDPGTAARPSGHRPRPLLHHRLLASGQRPALYRPPRRNDHLPGPQRQPDQRPRPAQKIGAGGVDLSGHLGHGDNRPSHRQKPVAGIRGGRGQGPGHGQGSLLPGHDDRGHAHRGPRSQGIPAHVPGDVERGLGGRLRDLRPGSGRGRVCPRRGAGGDSFHQQERGQIHQTLARDQVGLLHFRIHLFRPPGFQHLRP